MTTNLPSSIADNTNVRTCHPSGIEAQGPLDAEVMVVGVGPAREEMKTGKIYSGQTGKLLRAVLEAFDISPESCYITNLLCWWCKDPTMDEVMACAPRLVREIETVKPKVILALGALPITFFTGFKKTGDVRGSCIWNEDFNCWIVSTWQPTVVFQVSAGLIADIVRDVGKINYIKDKPKTLGHVSYEVVDSPVQAQQILDSDWLRTAQFPSLDVECRWDAEEQKWTSDIRCLAISDGDITYTFTEKSLEGLRWPTEDVHWTFHNGMFDTEKMMVDQGVELPICDDTMLMSYSLDERGGSDDEAAGVDLAVGIHGLKKLSREYCGAGFYEVDLKKAPDSIVYEYNAKDAAYTSRLAQYFHERQMEDNVSQVYSDMILPEATLCRDEKMHGVYVDRATVDGLAISWLEEWLQLDDWLEKEAIAYGWPEKVFNPNSPPQMKRFLTNYLQLPVDNSRADTLEKFKDHPWIANRIRWKKIDKQLGTYVVGTRTVVGPDSRVHPEPSIHATVTGRKSYHKPPIGTIPTGAQYADPDEEPDEETVAEIKEFSRVRAMFGAPPGKVLIEADYAAAELWTAAYLSNDKVMLEDLLSGDFHSRAAETMFKAKESDYDPSQWKEIRKESKHVTFGVLFLRGARSLFNPAPGQAGNLGKKFSFQEIQIMVEEWHKRYWAHWDWGMETIREARRTGEQVSLSGRKRRWHAPAVYGGHFDNMAINWPVQTTAHDHLIAARLDFDRMFRAGEFPARTLWDGHDAIYFEVEEDLADEACHMIKEVMERPRWFDRGLPVAPKVGINWAQVHEWPTEKGKHWREYVIEERTS